MNKTLHKNELLGFLLFIAIGCVFRSDIPEGWRTPETNESYDNWRKESSEKYLNVVDDFNGDNEMDEAKLLLKKKDKSIGLFIKYHIKGESRYFIFEIGDSSFIHSMGIRLVKPGKYLTACGKGYWECRENEPAMIELKHSGVDLFKYESANSFFYWDSSKNTFSRIWISD